MKEHPVLRISPADLESLLATLEVNFVALTECLVSTGYSLQLGGVNAPGIHYNLVGTGRAIVDNLDPVPLVPHTLIVVPPKALFRIEVEGSNGFSGLLPVDGRTDKRSPDTVRKVTAGGGDPSLVLVCGYFHATYGACADLFGGLTEPIFEQFSAEDQVDVKLQAALSELMAQEIGSGAMSAALLKQVIVMLLRRSLVSVNAWVERLSVLSDPLVARALAAMALRPGDEHSLHSLAHVACLSRSAFAARFTSAVGRPPMQVLRELRLRQAMNQLKAGGATIEVVARNAGYASRSSFIKAFRKAYGIEPSEVRRGA
ncbi:helix-turn-helix domain-containing protein [Ramlibacter ginsenosidimutans]|uniref:Helix-turn-helix domain-containing protein n=1 Tax=Ramlibacter ginsenosidimutans TaxID=502333 RepID=A0A934WMN0_9BURK|nr:AraC family transcriptional regulator [Ramlibacter ginsenosidimutans]MBK6006678.1 helix-turn-helix domain-containing protein [Ramlibacter ginsenosidimutans]